MEDRNNNTNINKNINHTINDEIYENTKNYFLNIYLNYYPGMIGCAIHLYLMFKYCLLEKDTEPIKEKNNNITLSNDDFDGQDMLIINDENKFNNLNIFNKNNIKEDKNKNSKYILSKICGFFYFREQTDLKGDIPCCKKLGNCMADFF